MCKQIKLFQDEQDRLAALVTWEPNKIVLTEEVVQGILDATIRNKQLKETFSGHHNISNANNQF